MHSHLTGQPSQPCGVSPQAKEAEKRGKPAQAVSRFPDIARGAASGGLGGSGGGLGGAVTAAVAAFGGGPDGDGDGNDQTNPFGPGFKLPKARRSGLFAKINSLTVQRTGAEKAEAVARAKETSRRAAIAFAKAEFEEVSVLFTIALSSNIECRGRV